MKTSSPVSIHVFLILAVVAVSGTGCRPDKDALFRHRTVAVSVEPADRSEDSPIVASIGNRDVRFDEVTNSLDALPVFVRMRYQAPERRLEFLEAFIEFQVLALSASSEGLAGDPYVVDTLKRELVSRYLRDEVDSSLRVTDIPESEIESWYEKYRFRYVHPAQNRVFRIVVTDEQEARRLAFRATELVREATGDPADVFRSLVKPPWVEKEGDLKVTDMGFFPDVSGAPSAIPPAVASVAVSMSEIFSVVGPVQADDGWSILFLAQKRPAADLGIDQARTAVASLILEERRMTARRALAESLRAGSVVTVDRDVLAGISAEAEVARFAAAPESR